jgi:hypothetical protein
MEFKIEVNQEFKTIEMRGEEGLSSFSNKVYFESMDLKKAIEVKVAPWISDCVNKANKDKEEFVIELHKEGKSISEICMEAETNEFFIVDTIRKEKYSSPSSQYYRDQIGFVK